MVTLQDRFGNGLYASSGKTVRGARMRMANAFMIVQGPLSLGRRLSMQSGE